MKENEVKQNNNPPLHNFTLENFQKSMDKMIETSESIYGNLNRQYVESTREYSDAEIERIINSGSVIEQVTLSRNYFNRGGFYARIIIHYATMMMYAGLVIPKPGYNKKLTDEAFKKKYHKVLEYVDNSNLPSLFTHWAIGAFRDGTYYGLISDANPEKMVLIDLPIRYCSSSYKNLMGEDIIEFNLAYFSTITPEAKRNKVLKAYPKYIQRAYRKFERSQSTVYQWIELPAESAVCFPLIDGRPLLLSVIPATIKYDKAVELGLEREQEEIRKIIVQKIPHMADGSLLFEPEEAQVIHKGTVNMVKNNKNLNVLTTYADVEAIVSRTSNESASDLTKDSRTNVFNQAGTSNELFNSTSNLALEYSLTNDMAYVMILVNKFQNVITNMLNRKFGKSGTKFKYLILPITYYNAQSYIDTTYKLANSGYSFILPVLGLGVGQSDLADLKVVENDIMKLNEKLIPLSSAFTQSGSTKEIEDKNTKEEENDKNAEVEQDKAKTISIDPNASQPGAPKKKASEKAPQTIANEKSLDKQGA